MKNRTIRTTLSVICIAVGLFGTIATSKSKKPKGEFISLTADPSVVCINTGIPVVRITFRAKSSNHQCVIIRVNNQTIISGFESPISSLVGQNRCGDEEWGETYGFSLNDLFGNNIPPTVTITAELFTGGSTIAQQTKLDSTGITITTRTCGPPDVIGN
jgi:hypothetical protein